MVTRWQWLFTQEGNIQFSSCHCTTKTKHPHMLLIGRNLHLEFNGFINVEFMTESFFGLVTFWKWSWWQSFFVNYGWTLVLSLWDIDTHKHDGMSALCLHSVVHHNILLHMGSVCRLLLLTRHQAAEWRQNVEHCELARLALRQLLWSLLCFVSGCVCGCLGPL